MSDEYERYAVYWVPRRSDSLARFGTSWTGWCADRGELKPRDAIRRLPMDVAAITRECRRHGFHGVIRAPFRLRTGVGQFALEHELAKLAEECVGFRLPRLRLAVVGGCVALAPREACAALGRLVAWTDQVVSRLAAEGNGFAEAPAPIARAGVDQLVQLPASAAHRFRLPLTDPLALGTAFEVMELARPLLEWMLDEPRRLDEIALMGDPGEGRPLRVLQCYELRDAPPRRATTALPCHGPRTLAPALERQVAEADLAI